MIDNIEEWVELTDGPCKFIMTRRELTNLAQKISRIMNTAKPIKPPIDGRPLGKQLFIQPIFRASVLQSPAHTGGKGDGATPAGPGEQGDNRAVPKLKAGQP